MQKSPKSVPFLETVSCSDDVRGSTRHTTEGAGHARNPVVREKEEILAELRGVRERTLGVHRYVSWIDSYYQYANRLAYQYYLRERNGIDSSLVFLYFTNAVDMGGPASEEEWHGATRLIHALMGLPTDLRPWRIHDAFIDARQLADAA